MRCLLANLYRSCMQGLEADQASDTPSRCHTYMQPKGCRQGISLVDCPFEGTCLLHRSLDISTIHTQHLLDDSMQYYGVGQL